MPAEEKNTSRTLAIDTQAAASVCRGVAKALQAARSQTSTTAELPSQLQQLLVALNKQD